MPLEAKNLYFRYSKNGPWILEDFSFSIEKGEHVAILAPSGYGKTTLALLLSGFLTPQKGQILLNGNPLPTKGVCPVQLVYQHPELAVNPRWRLKRVLKECSQFENSFLAEFGIEPEWLERFPNELSGGELQRFCVARAFSTGAEYIICDEITTMLDAVTQAQIWNVILGKAEKSDMGLIVITHNEHLAQRTASRIIHLKSKTNTPEIIF